MTTLGGTELILGNQSGVTSTTTPAQLWTYSKTQAGSGNVAGSNITITGTWPAQTISFSAAGAATGLLQPTGPASTSSASRLMMGFGNAASQKALITPTTTGRISWIMTVQVFNTTALSSCLLAARHGTGAAPAAGAAATGTLDTTQLGAMSSTANASNVITLAGNITGAALSTQLWFDADWTISGGGTCTDGANDFRAWEY